MRHAALVVLALAFYFDLFGTFYAHKLGPFIDFETCNMIRTQPPATWFTRTECYWGGNNQ